MTPSGSESELRLQIRYPRVPFKMETIYVCVRLRLELQLTEELAEAMKHRELVRDR